MGDELTPAERITEARERLEARMAELAGEVGDESVAGPLEYGQADAIVRSWGRIPDGTMDEIAEMHRLLARLSQIKSLPATQSSLALVPVNRVVEGLEIVIERLRERKSGAA